MESYKLRSIKEARLMKRSFSNNSFEFKPIKLKSLQEARNEKKSLSTRKLSLNPNDLSSLSKPDQTLSSKTSPSKSLIKPVLRKPLSQISKSIHTKSKSAFSNPGPSQAQPQPLHQPVQSSRASTSSTLQLYIKKVIKKPDISESSPKKLLNPAVTSTKCKNLSSKSQISSKPGKPLNPSKPSQSSSSRSLSKSKNSSILEVLSSRNKKLTKLQEQGLITRLQGKNLIKLY